MGFIWYLLGVLSGIVGLFIWAMVQSRMKKANNSENEKGVRT